MKGSLRLLSIVAWSCLACSEATPPGFTVLSDGGRDGGARDASLDGGGPCVAGALYCSGATQYRCSPTGEAVERVPCTGATPTCVPGIGCRACAPAQLRCNPTNLAVPERCRADGSGWDPAPACDASSGETCVGGACVSRCSESATGRSYLGCDYWPTVTANSQLDPHFEYAVVLSNPQTYAVHASITGGALTAPREVDLAAGAIETVVLPWVTELVGFTPSFVGCMGGSDPNCRTALAPAHSTLRRGGAYHVHSTGPIAAYQFNPLNFSREGGFYSLTNDASLLLPQGVLRQRYVVSTWPNWVVRTALRSIVVGGFLSIVATTGETTSVTVRPTTSVSAGPGVPIILAGTSSTFTLQPGDVLQLVGVDSRTDAMGRGQDLTGTLVESSQPVAVFVGHDCTNIPETRVACDHLEEQLLPIETWGRDSFVTGLRDRGTMTPAVVRIVSQGNDNQISFDPPTVHGPATLQAGQVLEFAATAHVRVSGTSAFLVSQFMIGQGPETAGMPGAGDPAMVFEVPVQQYRSEYAVYVPTTYPQNFFNVTAPAGTRLTLDDMPLQGTPEQVSGYDVYTVPVPGGAHRIRSEGSRPFGVKVYGVARYTSYMYPGGLDLQLITPG